jgi:hypothetical protein
MGGFQDYILENTTRMFDAQEAEPMLWLEFRDLRPAKSNHHYKEVPLIEGVL